MTCAIGLVAALASPAAAHPLPADQWSPRVHLRLAQCVVGEAGWLSLRDYDGIAWVLSRRWKRIVKRFPHMRFMDVLNIYCKALGAQRRELTPRQRWIRQLGKGKPEAWPSNARWDKHRPRWKAAYARMGEWSRGLVRDPCRGRALHWGGKMDVPLALSRGLVPISCGDTENIFFGGGR